MTPSKLIKFISCKYEQRQWESNDDKIEYKLRRVGDGQVAEVGCLIVHLKYIYFNISL